jgi:hypothetical protein
MIETTRVLRIEIDGKWSSWEFGQLFLSTTDLYNLGVILELLKDDWQEWLQFYSRLPPPPRVFERFGQRGLPGLWGVFAAYPWRSHLPVDSQEMLRTVRSLYPEHGLEIRRIQYSSPGFADVAGIGVVIGHIKEFLQFLLTYRQERRGHQLRIAHYEEDLTAKRIENARRFVALAQECGYDKSELRRLIHMVDDRQEIFVNQIEQEKVRAVHFLDEGNEPEPHKTG